MTEKYRRRTAESIFAYAAAAIGLVCLTTTTATGGTTSAETTTQCESLATTDFSNIQDAPAQIVKVESIPDSAELPAFCKVTGYVAPQVGFELRLPVRWNQKLIEIGCAGHCGNLASAELCPLRRGYSCIVTDSGHRGTGVDGLWADDGWQRRIDWGYRAPHIVALAGKAITQWYYGDTPRKSYFVGGSTGGRQALQEAQRFPWDFDGIVALNPPTELSRVYMMFAWGAQALRDRAGATLLSNADLRLLTQSVIAKCDLDDGLRDGVVSDPLHCNFSPEELACNSSRITNCLIPSQIDAARKMYAGPVSSSGEKLSHGLLAGSEFSAADELRGWAYLVSKDRLGLALENLAISGLRYLFFTSSAPDSWGLRDFRFDRDYRRLDVLGSLYDANNSNLRRFKDAGGKLIIVQGLNDTIISPQNTIDYYEAVERQIGDRSETQTFARLFLLPGVGHAGGIGAATIDYIGALEAWAENNSPPDKLIAARVKKCNGDCQLPLNTDFPLETDIIEFTRPIYPYPVRATYSGIGSPNDAESFVPVVPRESARLLGTAARSP